MLRPIGLEIGTTLEDRLENARLQKLQDRQHWKQPRYTQGLQLNDDLALAFLQDTCKPFQAEYGRLPFDSNGDETQYFFNNTWFGSVDAEVLYSVLRRFQPANVVEVGSGFSTRLMRKAIKDGRLATKITSIDPQPNTSVSPYADDYIGMPVEDLAAERLLDLLGPGDVLFIDSSHTATTGGDVPYLFLEILPRLRPGVLIHIHDIFLPFDYPAQWAFEGWGWNEQYLVHAFLAYNDAFEIIWPGQYMWERHRAEILQIVPNAPLTANPSSLWIKNVARRDHRPVAGGQFS